MREIFIVFAVAIAAAIGLDSYLYNGRYLGYFLNMVSQLMHHWQ